MERGWRLALGGLMFVFALTGCNGGSSEGSTPPVGGSGLSVDKNSIGVVKDQSGGAANTYVDVSWTSSSVTKIGAGPLPGQSLPGWLNLSFTGSTSPIRMHVSLDPGSLAYGTYQTTIRVTSYKLLTPMDSTDIPVTLTVVDSPTLSASNYAFDMVEGGPLPSSQTITLSRTAGSMAVSSASILFTAPSWLDVTHTQDTVTVALNSNVASLDPGNINHTVVVKYNGGSVNIPFHLTYRSALSVPSGITFNINHASTAADKTQTHTVASNRTSAINWAVAGDKSWLSLSPISGDTTTTDNLTVSLVQAELDTLVNGTYKGIITVSSSDTTVSDVTIPVTLNLSIPEVSQVAPYEALASTQADVIIRGSGFQALTSPALNFGGTPAISFTVVSDTEIHATHPSLALGTYPVNLVGASYTPRTLANLVVINPVNYLYAKVPDSVQSRKRDMFYNAERKSIYITREDSTTVQRLQYNGSSWTSTYSTSDLGIRYGGVAMSTNGQAIYAIDYPYLLKIDPDTMAKQLISGGPDVGVTYNDLAFANDGQALLTYQGIVNFHSSIRRYNFSTDSIDTLYSSTSDNRERIARASADGSTVYFVNRDNSWSIGKYNASDGTLTNSTFSIPQTSNVSVDRTGGKFIAGDNVYNSDFTLLGSLPDTLAASVISPDGSIAYGFESYTGSYLIRKFDLTNPDGSGGFAEFGTGTVIADTPGVYVTYNTLMAITPDGGSLFLVGGDNFLVVPAP